MPVDVENLRRSVSAGTRRLRITTHAQIEALKDGLLLVDLRHVFESGQVIEDYDYRALFYGSAVSSDLPVHLVVEEGSDEVVFVTAYVPNDADWIGYTRRRRSHE